ncbi:hypothetical protein [Actinophytocola oryzae]|uniref:hypothetical protein n=1 Tax=Actinophytocola oryzae TaxID=502181 RepID=UPI001063DCD6|nr:hypothetical protein [Actinophytocola oryzae]
MRPNSLNVLRLSSTLLSVVLLGIWVNVFTERLRDGAYLHTITRLGWGNLLLLGGGGCLIAGELATKRRLLMEHRDLERRFELLRHRQGRLLATTLATVCELVSKTLRVPCNGRYFLAVADGDQTYLEQDRELAVLTVRMPREFGFTRVAVDTPHIVIGRAFRERCPTYEDLPVDHHSNYEPRIARMIEPAQRWVLACPVLTLDAETNRHIEELSPHGVICFYGVNDPPTNGKEARVSAALEYAEQFANQMSQILNIIELVTEMTDSHAKDTEKVP